MFQAYSTSAPQVFASPALQSATPLATAKHSYPDAAECSHRQYCKESLLRRKLFLSFRRKAEPTSVLQSTATLLRQA